MIVSKTKIVRKEKNIAIDMGKTKLTQETSLTNSADMF
jgi:hypothetical protein